jgi:polyisoprenoid-binding protein YceI
MSKSTKIVIAAVVAAVVLVGAGVLWFANRGDDPLEAELPDVTETTDDVATDTTTGGDSTSATSAPVADGATGTWNAEPGDRDTFFVGYQIEETLRGLDITATGTTGQYEGSLVIDGDQLTSLRLTVDMTTLESDEGFRDDSLAGEGPETDEFPEATFAVTTPVTLPSVPAEGAEVTVEVTGDLTLHGVTRAVTIPVTARWNGDSIDATGEIPIVLAEYDITAPARGFVSVRDNGKVVFVVRFVRA